MVSPASDPSPGSGTAARGVPSRSCSVTSAAAWRLRASASRPSAGSAEPAGCSHAHTLQHRVGVLGDQLAPVLAAGRGGVGDGEAEAGGAVGGEQVQPAVALHPGGAPHVVGLGEHRDEGAGAVQVRDPQAVAAGGADVRRDDQPAAVVGDVDAVVVVLPNAAAAEFASGGRGRGRRPGRRCRSGRRRGGARCGGGTPARPAAPRPGRPCGRRRTPRPPGSHATSE